MEKVIVAAVAENRVIGREGDVPWHYPEDMEHFRETTMGSPVIMGRRTFESLPDDYRPLPGRTNIVLTRSDPELDESVKIANSLDEAWKVAEEKSSDSAYIIGGASVYRQALPEADTMIITEVPGEPEGDTYFPEVDWSNWEEVDRDDREELSFARYERT